MADTYSVCIMDGSWSDPDNEFKSVLTFYEKSWGDTLTLIQWATAEGYEVVVRNDSKAVAA